MYKFKSAILSIAIACAIAPLSAQDWGDKFKESEIIRGQWTDADGNTQDFPRCFNIDADQSEGIEYTLENMMKLFGKGGLMLDNNNNLDTIMTSPVTTGTDLVHIARGGKVCIDFFFGAGNWGNRLCYFYVAPDNKVEDNPGQIAKDLADGKIPTFCITNQMRAKDLIKYKSANGNGDWQPIPVNDELGKYFKGYYENDSNSDNKSVKGTKFTLKYYGENYNETPTEDFPKGTRIYFFLLTYNDNDWDGFGDKDNNTSKPFSIKFASRKINRAFGNQGNWANNNKGQEMQTKYGEGIIASAAINFWFTSSAGEAINLNILTWEDKTQADDSDWDFGDVAFALHGVNNPVIDISDESQIRLSVAPWSSFDPSTSVNSYAHWLDIINNDQQPIYSNELQSPSFYTDSEGKGHIRPGYTQIAINCSYDMSDNAIANGLIVIKKECVEVEGRVDGNFNSDDLVNPNGIYRLSYAYTPDTDVDITTLNYNKFTDDYVRGDNDAEIIPLRNMPVKYQTNDMCGNHWWYEYQLVFALRDGRKRTSNKDAVLIPRSEILVEPRGELSEIDFGKNETKHFVSDNELAIINNLTYLTIRIPRIETFNDKDILRSIVISGTKPLNVAPEVKPDENRDGHNWHVGNDNILFEVFKRPNGSTEEWEIRTPDGSPYSFEYIGETFFDEADWLVFATTIPCDVTVHAAYFTEFLDKHGKYIKNYYGIRPMSAKLPELNLNVNLEEYGVSWDDHDIEKDIWPFLFKASTEWTIEGLDNTDGILFNQWRSYNDATFVWNNKPGARLNIAHGTDATNGSIPADTYNRWIVGTSGAENGLNHTDNRWTNADILCQPYQAQRTVNAEYLLRAYVPSHAKWLKDNNRNASRSGGYYVLETRANANGSQPVITGIEDVADDTCDAPAVYHNLQGIRITDPEPGQLYIVVRGNKIFKEIF
ncbi:MAG: hypothetical protein Q4C34_06705 [Bacteroidales bacterium]|nr:hypothetical protein [Bacteroidales bacterium]